MNSSAFENFIGFLIGLVDVGKGFGEIKLSKRNQVHLECEAGVSSAGQESAAPPLDAIFFESLVITHK